MVFHTGHPIHRFEGRLGRRTGHKKKESVDSLLQKIRKILKPIGGFTALFSLWLLLPICSQSHAGRRVYTIQIGAFKEFRYAMNEIDKLKETGRLPFYRHEHIKGMGKLYKVYLEKYKERGEAEREAKQLKRLGLIKDYAIKTLIEAEEYPLKKASQQTDPKLVIKKIILNQGVDGTETLSIQANGFFWPSVLFSLEEKPPRLVIHINKAMTLMKSNAMPSPTGELIKEIRNLSQPKEEKVVIILELGRDRKYGVTQKYDEAENIFNLIVGTKLGE
ncbi:MAG: hypothetical protein AMK69_16350 [Nitrospira bacterium SG8_3]|nr:MAG: hypothetical protein AMK69_16350 [Nitrospira bacterium SG8_3]